MPRGDGTGPTGMGSMTGRGAGYCAGYPVPGFANFGRGGFGRGMGRGFGRMFYYRPGWAAYDNVAPFQNGQAYDEKSDLKNQEKFLESQLKQVKDRLKGFDEA